MHIQVMAWSGLVAPSAEVAYPPCEKFTTVDGSWLCLFIDTSLRKRNHLSTYVSTYFKMLINLYVCNIYIYNYNYMRVNMHIYRKYNLSIKCKSSRLQDYPSRWDGFPGVGRWFGPVESQDSRTIQEEVNENKRCGKPQQDFKPPAKPLQPLVDGRRKISTASGPATKRQRWLFPLLVGRPRLSVFWPARPTLRVMTSSPIPRIPILTHPLWDPKNGCANQLDSKLL